MTKDRSTSSPAPTCPGCDMSDQVYKVSRVYVEATAYIQRKEPEPAIDALLTDLLPNGSDAEKHALAARLLKDLAPPAGRTQVTRRIHPDWMIIFLCAVGLVIAYQVFRTQSESLPIIVALIAGALLFYLLARRPVLERYAQQSRQDTDEKRHVERAVERWMQLYLCAREPCVFDPETKRFVPLDQMRRLIGGL